MRNYLVTLLFVLGMLTSCGEMHEEITINEDGSGTYEISADIIPMMREMMKGLAALGLEEGETLDSLELDALIWEDFPEEVDSIMNMDDQIPDSVRNDPAKMALVQKMTVFQKGGKKKGYMRSGINFQFANSQEVMDFENLLEETSKEDKQVKLMGESNTTIELTPTLFYRSTTTTSASGTEDQGIDEMLGNSKIVTRINFSKKIKKVSTKTYQVVEQTATSVTLSYSFLEALNSEEPIEFRIELE